MRTGCLTCRDRHLKCDEALPSCLNCRKSNRYCKRGFRLNFIDITTHTPPVMLRRASDQINFQDESRNIASEYMDGLVGYEYMNKEVINCNGVPCRMSSPTEAHVTS